MPIAKCFLGLSLLCGSAGTLADDVDDKANLDRVTITVGRGQLRSVHGLERSEFANAIAGTSPLATLARLPGAHFQAADGLGNYEWSARFAMRGFSQSQLGFTLDDVPLGDMSYGNHNGLHISRAIASENLARASLSQGAGALDTASTSNLGGTVQFYSLDPAKAQGLRLQQTLGSDARQRLHARFDSGEQRWGAATLSLTQHRGDKWKGEGEQRQRQWNLKWVKQWEGHRASAFLNTSDREEVDYQDFSLNMLNRLGDRWDNFYPDFDAALNASRQLCGNGGSPYVTRCDDAYYAGAGLRRDRLAGASLDLQLSPSLLWRNTVYRHRNDGRGLWFTPYTASPDGTPISVRTTEYGIARQGWVASAEWELGAHKLKAGLWLERNHFDQARRFLRRVTPGHPGPVSLPQPGLPDGLGLRFRHRHPPVLAVRHLDPEPGAQPRFGLQDPARHHRRPVDLWQQPAGRSDRLAQALAAAVGRRLPTQRVLGVVRFAGAQCPGLSGRCGGHHALCHHGGGFRSHQKPPGPGNIGQHRTGLARRRPSPPGFPGGLRRALS
jgi:hypothetical protein